MSNFNYMNNQLKYINKISFFVIQNSVYNILLDICIRLQF